MRLVGSGWAAVAGGRRSGEQRAKSGCDGGEALSKRREV
jgi:hypothetical protein